MYRGTIYIYMRRNVYGRTSCVSRYYILLHGYCSRSFAAMEDFCTCAIVFSKVGFASFSASKRHLVMIAKRSSPYPF